MELVYLGWELSFPMDHMWESASLEAMRLGDMEFRREEVEEAPTETLSATATGTEQITEPIISVSKGSSKTQPCWDQCLSSSVQRGEDHTTNLGHLGLEMILPSFC